MSENYKPRIRVRENENGKPTVRISRGIENHEIEYATFRTIGETSANHIYFGYDRRDL